MRGTAKETNLALVQPDLLMGGERPLVILSLTFWGYMGLGFLPHWQTILVVAGFVVTQYILKLLAKNDPLAVKAFRRNSDYLLSRRYYMAKGYAKVISKCKKVQTVPTTLSTRI